MKGSRGFTSLLVTAIGIFIVAGLGFLMWLSAQELPDRDYHLTSSQSEKQIDISNWKTYKGDKFEVRYPFSWYVQEMKVQGSEIDSIFLKDGLSSTQPSPNQIRIACPRGGGEYATNLPNPHDWESEKSSYHTKHYNELTISNYSAIQYVWGSSEVNNEKLSPELCTALLRQVNPLVCELCTAVDSKDEYTQEYINGLEIYNQILSTFKFTD